jgi:RNA polymerase sigma-70 factor (ECF subfamily)
MSTLASAAMADAGEGKPAIAGIFEAARGGDLTAFERLMRQYERLVLGTALRLTGNLPDAQDVSQEVFLKLYRNLRKLPEDGRLAPWLYRVTVNACHDTRRRRRPESPMETAGQITSPEDDPQQAVTEAERRRVVGMSLRVLADKERAAIVLRDIEGLSTEEVARALGSSEATVRSHISKARVKMKDFVERYFGRRS